jgi:hypothetical protein
MMWKVLLTSVLIVAVSITLLAIRIILKKNGRFPNTHVGGNKALREKGIGCVEAQDAEMRTERKTIIKERTDN